MAKQTRDISDVISNKIENFKSKFNGQEDIVSVIKEDHQPLKELIKIMKDPDQALEDRKDAFAEFAPLLMTHAKAEEKALYDFMKTKSALRDEAFEGDTEHGIADQLCEEIKRVTDKDQLSAKIKVLAELVEHHIQEEETDILPKVQKDIALEQLEALTKKYVAVQSEIIAEGQDDSPHESEITDEVRKH